MAIRIRAVGTPVYGIANLTPVIPTAQLTGDMMICLYGTKPYSDAPTINQGWTSLGYATDGTVAAGTDVGSMQTRVFYKIAASDTETDPIVTNSTNNVSTAVIIVFQKDAVETWSAPVGAGGGDATAGTDFSVTVSSDVGHTTGDMVIAGASFRSDAATPTTARAVFIAGCTLGTYVQAPATDPETTSGGDMSMTCGYVPVNSGISSAAPVMTATLAAAHTGSAYLARLRVTAPVIEYLAGVVNGVATVSGATKASRKITGVASGIASVSGAAKTQKKIGGAISGVAGVSGITKVSKRVVCVVSGLATVSGATKVSRKLVGTSTSAAAVVGATKVSRKLVGLASGAGAVTGSARVLRKIVGGAAGISLVVGAIKCSKEFVAISSGVALIAGSLTVTGGGRTRRMSVV